MPRRGRGAAPRGAARGTRYCTYLLYPCARCALIISARPDRANSVDQAWTELALTEEENSPTSQAKRGSEGARCDLFRPRTLSAPASAPSHTFHLSVWHHGFAERWGGPSQKTAERGWRSTGVRETPGTGRRPKHAFFARRGAARRGAPRGASVSSHQSQTSHVVKLGHVICIEKSHHDSCDENPSRSHQSRSSPVSS